MKKWLFLLFKVFTFCLLGLTAALIMAFLAASAYKKDILTYFNSEINKGISGKAKLENIGFTIFRQFPSVSVSLHNLTIRDSVYETEVVRAHKVFLQVQLLSLLKRQLLVKSVLVEDADFNILKDSLGYSNLRVFKSQKTQEDSLKEEQSGLMNFNFRKIRFRNVEVSYLDNKKKKKVHIACRDVFFTLRKDDENVKCHITGRLFSQGLLFNNVKGPFIRNKTFDVDLDFRYNSKDSLATLKPSLIICEDQPYNIDGVTKLTAKHPLIYLNIHSDKTHYRKALSLLNTHLQKTLRKFDVGQNLSLQVNLILDTRPGVQPVANVHFQVNNSQVRFVRYFLDHVVLKGRFTTRNDTTLPAGDENSLIEIGEAGFAYNDLNFKVNGSLKNLLKPYTSFHSSYSGKLKAFHHYLDTTVYRFTGGEFNAEINQEGPVSLEKIPDPVMFNGHFSGHISVREGSLSMVKKNLLFSDINSNVLYKDKDLHITSVACKLNGNKVEMNGKLTGIIPFLLFPEKDVKVSMDIFSPYFDMNKILVKGAGGKDEIKGGSKHDKPLMGHLQSIINHIRVDMNTTIKQLQYKKLVTGTVRGNVSLSSKDLKVNNWSILMGKAGRIRLNGNYTFQPNDSGKVKLETELKNIDVSKLFYGLEDFGQKTLSFAQIEGMINARANLSCLTNTVFQPVSKTMRGSLQLEITNGQLNNFEPLVKVGNIIFKDRNLKEIRFGKIQNVFLFEGEEMYVEKMIINSSALSLYIEGVYSFRDKTDLSIQIPLANLKEHNSELIKVKDIEHGNIRLRAREKDGKMTIGLDLFNRFHHKHSGI